MRANRRSVLRLAGAMVATTGLAGSVSGTTQTTADDLPAYSRWLTLEDGTLEFTAVDWATLEVYVEDELEAEASPDDPDIPAEYDDDPMIAPASEGLLSAYLFVGLDLAEFRLGRLLEADAFDSSVERLLEVNEAFVATGSIDPAEIDTELTAESDAAFFRQFEPTDEIGGYDVYTPVEGADAAIAVDDDALVIVADETIADPLETLETTIDVDAGTLERATDESESIEWLLETAGDGDVTVGQYGGPFDADDLVHPTLEELGDLEGVVSSLTVEDHETSSGTFAAILEDPDENTLEERLGASADERTVEVDENRVTATATWRLPD